MEEDYIDLDELLDMFYINEVHYIYHTADGISETLGLLERRLSRHYDGNIDWDYLDRNDNFAELFAYLALACESIEGYQMLAIFCLDRGLVLCQIESLLKEAYDQYLLPEALSAKRLIK